MSDSTTHKHKYIFYHYYPSEEAAIAMIVLFSLVTTVHVVELLRRRTWYFIPFVIGGLFEVVGYVGRLLSSRQSPNWTLVPYVMQSLLLLLAPTLFAASMYMVLSRIILLTGGESRSVISSRWLTKTFVWGDVLSFALQAAGGGLQSSRKIKNGDQLGQYVVLGGLGAQILFFGIFVIVASIFHSRILRNPTLRSQTVSLPWQRYLLVLYIGSGLILIRSVFRIIEYAMGQHGYLLSTEAYLYAFDGALMFLNMTLFAIYHPGRIITQSKKELQKQDLESVPDRKQKPGGFSPVY